MSEGCRMNLRPGGNYRYPGTSHDPRSLESPTDGDSQRELGVFFTLDPRDCLETCTIDLDYSPGGLTTLPCTLSTGKKVINGKFLYLIIRN